MKNKYIFLSLAFFVISALVSCKKDEVGPELTVSPAQVSLRAGGDTLAVNIISNDNWTISNSGSTWSQLSESSGGSGNITVKLMARANTTGATRNGVLTITSDNGQARRVQVSQVPTIYPSYNTSPKQADASGMSSTASELAAKMKLGWNIGNTMEAPGGETGWGNPKITEEYVKFVKQSGFNAIRIPCAWDWHHVENKATARIDPNWLNRVKEVVDYCVKNDIYVLLNIHWDGGWLDDNINKLKKDSINAKQKAYWEQIATTMRDFDEHLMFASANEPPVDNAEQMEILNSYHQTFIDAVRSTGGRNSYRVLVVQGPGTDILKTHQLMNKLPKDPVPNRLMIEVHNYTPSLFCIMFQDQSWGKMFYYWGAGNHSTIESDRNATWGEENEHVANFAKMKEKFVDKGIPVLMGEYGAYRRQGEPNEPKDLPSHHASVDHWITFVTKQARANGVIPFWWDTGGALDRTNYTIKDKRTIDALMAGGE